MNYILLHKQYGYVSISMTLDKMEEECSMLVKQNRGDWIIREKGGKISHPDSIREVMRGSNIINWGNRIFADDYLFKINKPSGIRNASDKTRARNLLQKAGVAVPHTTFYGEQIPQYPFIARPTNHHGGKGFYVIRNKTDAATLWKEFGEEMQDWYFSEVFDKTHEFRVHVASGKSLIVHTKPAPEDKTELRWNHIVNHDAWRALRWSEREDIQTVINQESIKACEVLGLDYAAVDIMWNDEKGVGAICEVNTSPSINTEYSSGKYAAYFDWLIRHDFPKPQNLGGKSIFYNKLLRE